MWQRYAFKPYQFQSVIEKKNVKNGKKNENKKNTDKVKKK
jgi:hypothetical protein